MLGLRLFPFLDTHTHTHTRVSTYVDMRLMPRCEVKYPRACRVPCPLCSCLQLTSTQLGHLDVVRLGGEARVGEAVRAGVVVAQGAVAVRAAVGETQPHASSVQGTSFVAAP